MWGAPIHTYEWFKLLLIIWNWYSCIASTCLHSSSQKQQLLFVGSGPILPTLLVEHTFLIYLCTPSSCLEWTAAHLSKKLYCQRVIVYDFWFELRWVYPTLATLYPPTHPLPFVFRLQSLSSRLMLLLSLGLFIQK